MDPDRKDADAFQVLWDRLQRPIPISRIPNGISAYTFRKLDKDEARQNTVDVFEARLFIDQKYFDRYCSELPIFVEFGGNQCNVPPNVRKQLLTQKMVQPLKVKFTYKEPTKGPAKEILCYVVSIVGPGITGRFVGRRFSSLYEISPDKIYSICLAEARFFDFPYPQT